MLQMQQQEEGSAMRSAGSQLPGLQAEQANQHALSTERQSPRSATRGAATSAARCWRPGRPSPLAHPLCETLTLHESKPGGRRLAQYLEASAEGLPSRAAAQRGRCCCGHQVSAGGRQAQTSEALLAGLLQRWLRQP